MAGDKANVTFYSDGRGRWTKRVWAKQCKGRALLTRCQGVEGHNGEHWCYSHSGSLERSMPDGGAQSIPPGHKTWISPIDMQPLFHVNHYEDSEVTDPEVIKRLEAGDLSMGSINRPVREDEL